MAVGRKAASPADEPGQDSFLDIVANLVGILIILIMVIGARATNAMVDAAPARPEPAVDVETPKRAAEALEANLRELGVEAKRQDLEIAYRRSERDKLNVLIASVERAMEQQREKLSDAQRARYDLRQQLAAARRRLEELERRRDVIERTSRQPIVIRHLPTPLAQTVFGREVHFRLLGGRIAYVPWDEMVARLKREAPQKVWKLRNAEQITETIPPLMGFRLQYTLKRVERRFSTPAGVAVQQTVELDRFVFLATDSQLGEPLETALQDGSQLRKILDGLDPRETTVTVWVYPDSFNAFRRLKEFLYQHGFATAARPLPDGHPIGGSPHGTRSAAQ